MFQFSESVLTSMMPSEKQSMAPMRPVVWLRNLSVSSFCNHTDMPSEQRSRLIRMFRRHTESNTRAARWNHRQGISQGALLMNDMQLSSPSLCLLLTSSIG